MSGEADAYNEPVQYETETADYEVAVGSSTERQPNFEVNFQINHFSVWHRNRIIFGGLEPVLSQTEKLCITSYYIQFLVLAKAFSGLIKLGLIL